VVIPGLALTGGLLLPIAGYLGGKSLIGAYEGKAGLAGYLASIYSGAGRGDLLAWWLLLSPTLILLVWYLIVRWGWRPADPPHGD
jgi:H+/Cl- antiporter ClcA